MTPMHGARLSFIIFTGWDRLNFSLRRRDGAFLPSARTILLVNPRKYRYNHSVNSIHRVSTYRMQGYLHADFFALGAKENVL